MTRSAQERPRSSERSLFRFCPRCATALARRVVHGRSRPVCPDCGFVQWRNPVVGVAAILEETALVALLGTDAVRQGQHEPAWIPAAESRRVLLVRRTSSYAGLWCLPCGYVEYDEDLREALEREVLEETGLIVRPGEVFAAHSNFHEPDQQSVGIWFRVEPIGGRLAVGDDADAAAFYPPDRVPVPLAFPTDRLVLQALAEDRSPVSRSAPPDPIR